MEDGGDSNKGAATLSMENGDLTGRPRSGSASSGHKRTLSGSLLSKLSFLRMSQGGSGSQITSSSSTTSAADERAGNHTGGIDERDNDGDDVLRSSLRGERAMSNALQHQRRTRRRRGSLRKTALLGTRFDNRDKKASSRLNGQQPPTSNASMRSLSSSTSTVSHENEHILGDDFDSANDTDNGPQWGLMDSAQKRLSAPAGAGAAGTAHHRTSLSNHDILGEEEIAPDDDDVVSLPRLDNKKINNNATAALRNSSLSSNGAAAGLHLPLPPSSSSDSYFALQPESKYHTVHRTKSSPLATTHAVDMNMKTSPDITLDYSETEWWGWIILIVTWLVFVVGMGSCFEVWSWAWDVGETPYAPPELEDDPTLPIVGYYPALIILTGVMSWVWVVVAWVGMKYFKHANISGEDI